MSDEERKRENERSSRDAGIYAYSRVAGSLLLFLAVVIGPRVYTVEDFAFVGALILLYETAMALGSLGLADSVYYFIGRDTAAGPRVVRQTTLLLLAVAVPVIGVVMLAGSVTSVKGVDVSSALPWIALVLLVELPTQPAVNQLIASGRPGFASAVYISFSVLRLIALVGPGIIGLSINEVPIAMAITAVVRLVVYWAIVRRWFPFPPGDPGRHWLRKDQLREILWFALPAGAGMLAGRLNPQIDKFAVNVLMDEHAFAMYSVAAYELPLITLVPYAIAAVMQPRYVKLYTSGDYTGLRDLWFATVRKIALLVVPLAMVIIALGSEMVIAIGGADYADAALPFQIFTVVILHRVAAYGAILQAIGQTRMTMLTSFLLLASNALLTYPMTLLFGFPGPAIASVLAVLPPWLLTLSRVGGVFGGGVREALPWGFYGKVVLLGAVLALAVWGGVQALPEAPAVRLSVGTVMYLGVYIALGRAFGFITREDLGFVTRWLTLRM